VASQLFPHTPRDEIPTGLTGPIMTHEVVVSTLLTSSPLPLQPISAKPITGVQRLLTRALQP
jgi:hypothetical protein